MWKRGGVGLSGLAIARNLAGKRVYTYMYLYIYIHRCRSNAQSDMIKIHV